MRLRRSATDFKHFSNKNGRFSVKTYHFCVIARRAQFFAPDAAIFNGTKRHPGTKFGETARSGMRPTCTPSPCTSCLVFPYKTAGRSKQIRLLLLFASGWRARPTSLLGGVSTILRTASRFFIRFLCAFCRSYTGSDEKTPRTRSGSQTLQAVKKVRNRQNQSPNKNRFTESEDWILRSVFSPTDSVIARRARAPDAAILSETICHPGTKYGRTERNRTLK